MSQTESHDRQHPTLTLGVLSLSALAYILLQSMVLPALPEIGRALHTSQSTVAVTVGLASARPSATIDERSCPDATNASTRYCARVRSPAARSSDRAASARARTADPSEGSSAGVGAFGTLGRLPNR